MKNIKFFEEFNSSDYSFGSYEITEGHGEMENYMFFQNLHTLKHAVEELLELDPHKVDQILSDGHGWALDHIATSVDDVDEVYHFLSNSVEMGGDHEGYGHSEEGEDSEESKPAEINIMGDDDKVEVESGEEE